MGKLSRAFKHKVIEKRLEGVRSYELAQSAELDSTVLSAMLHDARTVRLGDPRIVKLGKKLGLRPGECFEP